MVASWQRLADSLKYSDGVMSNFRRYRRILIQESGGPYWGSGFSEHRPVNLLYSLLGTLVPSLALDPRYEVETREPELRAMAPLLGLYCDSRLADMDIGEVIRRAVMDSFFGAGVVRIGLGATSVAGGAESERNWLEDPGEPFAEYVDQDDWIPDMSAKVREERDYEANRYEVPFDWAMDSGLYNKRKLEELFRSQSRLKEKRASELTTGELQPRDPKIYSERVTLCDVWFPGEQRLVTVAGHASDITGYLAEQDWEGPEGGPYEELGYIYLPGNAYPVGLLPTIYDLYVLINKLATKAGRGADRSKQLVLASQGHESSAENVRKAVDGEVVLVPDAKEFANVVLGGADERTFTAIQQFFGWLNRVAGNPDLLGGVAARSKTLGQDQMLMGAALTRIKDWRERVMRFADGILTKLAYWFVTDPVDMRELSLELPSGLPSIPVLWDGPNGEVEVGGVERYELPQRDEVFRFKFKIDPYAKQRLSPEQQYERLVKWLAEVVLPLSNLGMAQGQQLDVPRVVELAARGIGLPDAARDLFQMGEEMTMPGMVTRPGVIGGDKLTVTGGEGAVEKPEGRTREVPNESLG